MRMTGRAPPAAPRISVGRRSPIGLIPGDNFVLIVNKATYGYLEGINIKTQ